ncbi:zinc-binding metallopeptidase family protein [Hoyosella altamirensis]|uniref:Zinc-ribbon domain-containing protein n=1 Tax=Hoyosella altamirensis TaxID=616997 RepID=A0A839RT59_9ACTN|nr:putative zinc-binding metallopeptidase [Hoyosella altamirensis]MBB3039376.1 hypothetical protein [Hoyosella altamirensis]
MRDFLCRTCGQRLTFENTQCLRCRSFLGFHLPSRSLVVLDESGATQIKGTEWVRCANRKLAHCNWLVPTGSASPLCASCALTRTRPAEEDPLFREFANAETAKRRVILELDELGLPLAGRDEDPRRGLGFDLLSSVGERVITGHASGLITLDLAEGDDLHRERLRVEMDEPYRTLVGHFRHEIGHYYQMVLINTTDRRATYDALFGDFNADYQAALKRHYREGPPDGWSADYVSSYATMHPAEDWAETFAHYLHIRDALDTAAAFGFAPSGASLANDLSGDAGFNRIIDWWLPLAWALNQVNRSMGHSDLYPFVLRGPVLKKMRFIHQLVQQPRY